MDRPRVVGDVSGVDLLFFGDGDYRYAEDREIPFDVVVRLDDGEMIEWKSDEEHEVFLAEKPKHSEGEGAE